MLGFHGLSQKGKQFGLLSIFLILIVGALLYFTVDNSPTFIRIVDTSDSSKDTSPSPGADIRGAEIVKSKKQQSFFATEVVSTFLLDGPENNTNNFKDGSVLLGDPNASETQEYVSLGGVGGQVVLKVLAGLEAGDEIHIYEIGNNSGPRSETVDIFTSSNESGPWTFRGTGAGPFTLVVE